MCSMSLAYSLPHSGCSTNSTYFYDCYSGSSGVFLWMGLVGKGARELVLAHQALDLMPILCIYIWGDFTRDNGHCGVG